MIPVPPPPHMHEDEGTVEGCPGCMWDIAHYTENDPEPPDSPVALAHVIAEAIRDLAGTMQEHEHHWDILSAQAPPKPEVRLPMVSPIAATYVLVRCTLCGYPDGLTIAGTWELADLRAGGQDRQ
jgi:hypothetical protein